MKTKVSKNKLSKFLSGFLSFPLNILAVSFLINVIFQLSLAFSKSPAGQKPIADWREILKAYPIDPKLNRMIIKAPKGAVARTDELYWKNWQYEILLGPDGKPIEYEIFTKNMAEYPSQWIHEPHPFIYQVACVRNLPTKQEYCVDDVIFRKEEQHGKSCTIAGFEAFSMMAGEQNLYFDDRYFVQGELVQDSKYTEERPPTERIYRLYRLHRGRPILSSDHFRHGFRIMCREQVLKLPSGENRILDPFINEKHALGSFFKLANKCKRNCIGRPAKTQDLKLELPSDVPPKPTLNQKREKKR